MVVTFAGGKLQLHCDLSKHRASFVILPWLLSTDLPNDQALSRESLTIRFDIWRARGDLNPGSPAFFHLSMPGGLRILCRFGALIRTGQRAR